MIYARFEHKGNVSWGSVEGERVQPLAGDIFGQRQSSGDSLPLSDVRLLAPALPSKIIAAAVNYHSHVEASRAVLAAGEAPKQPELFLKPPSAVVGPEDAIVLPPDAGRVDYEGELVAVIGRTCRNVTPAEALDHVFGYTCGNDVSARDWQRGDLQWWRAKGVDTFAPLGPWLVTGLDPRNLQLRTRLNGQEVQSTNTQLLIQSVANLVSFASRVMTLLPGDLVFTGTPGETGAISAGDIVEVEIEGIGVLSNPVR